MTDTSADQVHLVVERIEATLPTAAATGRPLVVVIDGPGGSGKSTLARAVAAECTRPVAVVEGDDFYADLDDAARSALDPAQGCERYFDWRRLRAEVLEPARTGRPVRYRPYDWEHGGGLGDEVDVPDAEVLIVEGVYTARPQLRDLADVVVWVDTDPGERLRRLLARGENAREWIDRWSAAERWYEERVRVVHPDDVRVLGG